MLNKVKLALRINNNAYDVEITDLINACTKELELVGIASSNTDDEMIIQAIILYCKANFGFDNNEAERYMNSYNSIKTFLSLNKEYITKKESE